MGRVVPVSAAGAVSTDSTHTSPSVGPAGATRLSLATGGFIWTWSVLLPKGSGGMVPGFIRQRRLNTCVEQVPTSTPTVAGARLFAARWTPSAMRAARNFRYAGSGLLWKTGDAVGAVWVCVAEIR